MSTTSRTMPRWAVWCGVAAIAATLPTIVWRVVVGFGATLGTPQSWREREALPGSGTTYVVGLSVVQLLAALATLVLIAPGGDRVPRRSPVAANRRLPAGLVVGLSMVGTAAVAFLCVASVLKWSNVDPFGDAATNTGWTYLCWACYAAALFWAPMLFATTIGYARSRSAGAAAPVPGVAA